MGHTGDICPINTNKIAKYAISSTTKNQKAVTQHV